MKKTIIVIMFVIGLIFHFSISNNSLIAQTGSGTGGTPSTGGAGSCDIGTTHRYKSKILTSVVAVCGSCLVPKLTEYEKVCDNYYRARFDGTATASASYSRVECISVTVGDSDQNSTCTQVFATDFNCPSSVVAPGVFMPVGGVLLDGTDLSPCTNTGTGTGTGF